MAIQSSNLSKPNLAVNVILALIVVLVLANICSPLRLNTDGFRYFNIMLYLTGQLPPGDFAGRDFLPHGYPWLLKILASIGWLNSQVIISINILAAAGAGYLICKLLPQKNWRVLTALIFLSYINVKHLTLPTADELFAGCLLLSIWCCTKAIKRKALYYIPAVVVTIIAIYLRTAGIVIPGGVILYVAWLNREFICKKWYIGLIIVIVLIIGITAFLYNLKHFEQQNDYFRQLNLEHLFYGDYNLISRLFIHFQEVGEFILNVPYVKISTVGPHSLLFLVKPVLIFFGAATLMLVCFIAVKAKVYQQLIFWVYACYLGMILIWPFYDGRFLIPIIPLFVYCLYIGYEQYKRFIIVKVFLAIYVLMGITSLSYSAAISTNQQVFLKLYGNDKQLSGFYKTHFRDKQLQKPVVYNIDQQKVLYILSNYDK